MDRGVVRVLEEGALVDRAVAEEAGDDRVQALQPQPQRRARCDPEPAPDDTIRAEHADREVGDVHRPALAVARARGSPEQLGHHRLDRDALGDRVAVAAVGRGDPVGRTQRGTRPDGNSLLPDRGVGGAPDAAHLDHQGNERVELADADHAPIEVDGVGRRERREGLVGQRRVPWRAVILLQSGRVSLRDRQTGFLARIEVTPASCGRPHRLGSSAVSGRVHPVTYCDLRTVGPLYETVEGENHRRSQGLGDRRSS